LSIRKLSLSSDMPNMLQAPPIEMAGLYPNIVDLVIRRKQITIKLERGQVLSVKKKTIKMTNPTRAAEQGHFPSIATNPYRDPNHTQS